MSHIEPKTRHFRQGGRFVAVAALAGLLWGCDGGSSTLTGAGGASGAAGANVAGAGGGGSGGMSARGAGSGGSGGGGGLPVCAGPVSSGYGDFFVCYNGPAPGTFTYEASGTLSAISAPLAEAGECPRAGGRRLTVQPAAGAATSVDIYAVGDADISALLSPLVGSAITVRATYHNLFGHQYNSLFVSDARGPLIYVVNSSSCPGEAYPGTRPPELASLTVEHAGDLCYDANQQRGYAESRFEAGGQTVTLAPGQSGQVSFDGRTYDVRALHCSVQGPMFQGGDGYPAGAWALRRRN
jgi:hypothetical protein